MRASASTRRSRRARRVGRRGRRPRRRRAGRAAVTGAAADAAHGRRRRSTSRATSDTTLEVTKRRPARTATSTCPMNKTIGLLLTPSTRRRVARDRPAASSPRDLSWPRAGEPRGGADQGGRRDRDPRARAAVGAPPAAQGHATRSARRASAVGLDSARAVRARPGRRRGSDGRRHRSGGRGLRPACLAPRRGAGRGRSRARRDAEEPGQARREGRRRSRTTCSRAWSPSTTSSPPIS